MDRILIVMCGAPGSGKSTAADAIAADFGFDIVCPDDIRAELFGDAADQSDGWKVFDIAYSRLVNSFADGQAGVVFDATNCKRRARREILRRAEGLFSHVVCAVSDVDLDTCLQRNAQRDRVVPEDVIERMHSNLHQNWPDVGEGFDEVVLVDELYWCVAELLG